MTTLSGGAFKRGPPVRLAHSASTPPKFPLYSLRISYCILHKTNFHSLFPTVHKDKILLSNLLLMLNLFQTTKLFPIWDLLLFVILEPSKPRAYHVNWLSFISSIIIHSSVNKYVCLIFVTCIFFQLQEFKAIVKKNIMIRELECGSHNQQVTKSFLPNPLV